MCRVCHLFDPILPVLLPRLNTQNRGSDSPPSVHNLAHVLECRRAMESHLPILHEPLALLTVDILHLQHAAIQSRVVARACVSQFIRLWRQRVLWPEEPTDGLGVRRLHTRIEHLLCILGASSFARAPCPCISLQRKMHTKRMQEESPQKQCTRRMPTKRCAGGGGGGGGGGGRAPPEITRPNRPFSVNKALNIFPVIGHTCLLT